MVKRKKILNYGFNYSNYLLIIRLKRSTDKLELMKEIKICRLGVHINCFKFDETLGLIIIGTSDETLAVINTNF